MKTLKVPYEQFAIKMIGQAVFDDVMTRMPSDEEIRKNEAELNALCMDMKLDDFDDFLDDAIPKHTAPASGLIPDLHSALNADASGKPAMVVSPHRSTAISIRVPTWLLVGLKHKAKSRGIPYQTLMKKLLAAGLAPT